MDDWNLDEDWDEVLCEAIELTDSQPLFEKKRSRDGIDYF